MNLIPALPLSPLRTPLAREEAACWAVGLGFTFAVFFILARVENFGGRDRPVEIQDMPVVSLPFEPPPPQPQLSEPAPAPEEMLPLTGIEIGASDSPVKIAVAPPDIEALLPSQRIPPRAAVSVGRLYSELRPRVDIQVDARHVYQQSEVDQRPRAIVRVAPAVPGELFGKAPSLAVTLLLVIDTNGRAESARVAKSSGVAGFDAIVAQTVMDEWLFSPAIKRGRKVRCLAEQAFRVVLGGGGTPFNLE